MSGKSLTKAKVLVVHRIGFVRSGVLSLIAKSMHFVTCGETDEAPLARELFVRSRPNVAVVGILLHGGDGIQLIKEFRGLNPAVALIALAEHPNALSIQRAFRAGARGYLGIDDAPELLSALIQISAGYSYVGASVLPLILDNFAARKKGSRDSDVSILSDRELEIFWSLGRGLTVSELANELHVSVKTIETHQMRMKEKLGSCIPPPSCDKKLGSGWLEICREPDPRRSGFRIGTRLRSFPHRFYKTTFVARILRI